MLTAVDELEKPNEFTVLEVLTTTDDVDVLSLWIGTVSDELSSVLEQPLKTHVNARSPAMYFLLIFITRVNRIP